MTFAVRKDYAEYILLNLVSFTTACAVVKIEEKSFVILQPFWILGEPTLQHTLTLVEHFEDSPKGGERKHSENDAQINIFKAKGHACTCNSCDKKSPPAFSAEIIFALNNQRMKKADDEEGCQSDENAHVVHICPYLLVMRLQR